jgi:hypothetical protein
MFGLILTTGEPYHESDQYNFCYISAVNAHDYLKNYHKINIRRFANTAPSFCR